MTKFNQPANYCSNKIILMLLFDQIKMILFKEFHAL